MLVELQPGAGFVRCHRTIERMATLAAINLGILPEFPDNFLARGEPALQVSHAEFALRVFHVASPLAGLLFSTRYGHMTSRDAECKSRFAYQRILREPFSEVQVIVSFSIRRLAQREALRF